MSETVDFDISHNYNLFKSGIVVNAGLKFGDLDFEVEASIDTGSTYCVFSRFVGEELGLDVEAGIDIVIGTATGKFRAFGHEITLIVLGLEIVSTVYFAESDHFDRNVLGRSGFLNRVKLGLIEPEGKLYLSLYQ